jgi:NADPH:quinone reductase-like Zn-dependent oxidoreductase
MGLIAAWLPRFIDRPISRRFQWAMGATVIACARGKEKLEVCKAAGADHLIDSETDDIRAKVKELGGADVVYDPVGGDQFKAAFRACNPEARLIPLGFASGEVPQIPANHLLVKNISVIGHYWGGYNAFKPSVITESMMVLGHGRAQVQHVTIGGTKDGKVTLHTAECLAACGQGPMMQVDKTYYEHLTSERVDEILDELVGKSE